MKKTTKTRVFRLLPFCGFMILGFAVNADYARPAIAAEAQWSDWTPLDDKAQKGIDWRVSQENVAGDEGLFRWNYQFRNRYPRKVKFQSTLTYEDKNGALQTETRDWEIASEANDASYLLCKRLVTTELSKLEFVKANNVNGDNVLGDLPKDADTLGAPPPDSLGAPPVNAPATDSQPTNSGRAIDSLWRLAPQPSQADHLNPVSALAFSPDGAVVASCSWRQVNGVQVSEIILRDAASGQALQRMEGRWETLWNGKGPKPPWIGHWGKINSVAFSPEGTSLVSGGEDGRITLWDAKTGKALRVLPKVERPLISLFWTGPKTIAGLSRDGKVTTWSLTDSKVQTLQLANSASGDWVRVGAISPDGKRVAIGDASGGLTVWNMFGGNLIRKLNNSLYQNFEQPQGVETTALAFTPDGQLLLTANHAHIYLNSIEKNPELPDHRAKLLFAGQRVRQLVVAPDSQTAAAICEGKVIILNLSAKKEADARINDLAIEGNPIREMAVSPNQNAFVSGSGGGKVVLWK